MHDILLFGAGKIGKTILHLLSKSGDYRITVADSDPEKLGQLPSGTITVNLDAHDSAALTETVTGKFALLSAAPYNLSPALAEAAKAGGAHYLDLTEDVASTRYVKKLAEGADTAFIPQCGLAPGFISIAAYDLASKFDALDTVHMRVGALPLYPTNALKYNLTWSTDGLINEYLNPCEAIHEGELREVLPLQQKEHFSLDGLSYEAFNTSGGLGTLCDTLSGRVRNLNYKTVRYPGHCEIVRMLVHDLKLGRRKELLKEILENAIPITMQDVVLIFITVSGYRDGQFVQESFAKKVYSLEEDRLQWSAIQITTASGICTALDLLAAQKIPTKGFVRQEQISLDLFLNNRFGKYYN